MVATMSKSDEIHTNSVVEKVALSKLQVDFSYQREISESLVDEIANDWDVVASELILVSNRGNRPTDGDVKGGLFIVNGQHRSKAAQKLGLTGIDARIMDLRKAADPGTIEAGFRLKTNKRLGDRPLERFKAQLRAGDTESQHIVQILERFDTHINSVPQAEIGINCVSTIEQLYRVDDGALLSDTAGLIRDTLGYFGGKNARSAFIKGLAWFVEKHATETNRERVITKIQGVGSAALESRARTTGLSLSGSLWMNYYRSLVALYNENLSEKNKLSWKLRGKGLIDKSHGPHRDA